MKFFVAILFFVFARFSHAQSQSSGADILKSAVANLPPCALQCTLTTIGASTCELTDIDCIKGNEELLNKLSVCVKSSCRVKEALTAKKFLQELLGAPVRDKTRLGTLTSLIVGGVALLCFLLRAIARLPVFGGNWGLDDWVITAAMVFIIPLTICAYVLNQYGFGKDMWLVPFDNVTKVLEIFYYTELLYLTSIALTKISMLLFYLRIFPHQNLRRAIYVTIVFCVLYIIAFVTATALQCLPVRYAWERWDGEHHGKCIDLNADAWASAAVNIILDVIVIVLPMKELTNLAMSRRRKFGVMLMFLGGGFVTIVSILRLKFLVQFANTDNVTWDYLPIGYWSAVESHVGIIVACLPAIRSLQRSIRDRLWSKPPNSSSYYEDDTRNSSKKSGYKWSSKDRSRLSTLNRSKADKEDFVQLDEWEMQAGRDDKKGAVEDRNPIQSSSERSLTRSFKSDEDVLPLASTAAPAPTHRSTNGIMVQTEFSVDRASTHSRLPQIGLSAEDLMNQRRFRL